MDSLSPSVLFLSFETSIYKLSGATCNFSWVRHSLQLFAVESKSKTNTNISLFLSLIEWTGQKLPENWNPIHSPFCVGVSANFGKYICLVALLSILFFRKTLTKCFGNPFPFPARESVKERKQNAVRSEGQLLHFGFWPGFYFRLLDLDLGFEAMEWKLKMK